jgi:hypothetical protein
MRRVHRVANRHEAGERHDHDDDGKNERGDALDASQHRRNL